MGNPIILSFLLADKVFREMETGKVHIAGTFNRLSAYAFPMLHPQFFTYIAISDLSIGEHSLMMELQYFESGEKLLRVDQKIKSSSPLEVIEVSMCFNQIVFKDPGNVELILSLNGQIMQTRKLVLKKLEK
jgi:hypothetical protein